MGRVSAGLSMKTFINEFKKQFINSMSIFIFSD